MAVQSAVVTRLSIFKEFWMLQPLVIETTITALELSFTISLTARVVHIILVIIYILITVNPL